MESRGFNSHLELRIFFVFFSPHMFHLLLIEKMAGNWVTCRSSIVAVAGRAFLLRSEFTVIRLIKESLSGKLFKISIFATSLK